MFGQAQLAQVINNKKTEVMFGQARLAISKTGQASLARNNKKLGQVRLDIIENGLSYVQWGQFRNIF